MGVAPAATFLGLVGFPGRGYPTWSSRPPLPLSGSGLPDLVLRSTPMIGWAKLLAQSTLDSGNQMVPGINDRNSEVMAGVQNA